ncbi:MAG: hypothetical protein RR978_03930 [Oscillospiraceae bacterium]
MKLTVKTYYGLCVASAALSILQCALFAFGYNASLFGSVALLLFGGGLLFLASAATGKDKTVPLVAAILLVLGLMPKFGYILAALAWPCFALTYARQAVGARRNMAQLVIIAGAVQLVCGFMPLGRVMGGVVGGAIAAVQLLFSLCLFKYAETHGGQK